MTKKTDAIKERLQAYAEMRRDHEIQLERLERLRASMEYKSPSFEPIPGGGGGDKDKMTNYVAEVMELEKEMATTCASWRTSAELSTISSGRSRKPTSVQLCA